MRRAHGSLFIHAAAAALFVLAASLCASAQATGAAPAADAQRASADEDFELNIEARRITEAGFSASTEAEAGREGGLRVRVGVMVSAVQIDVLLRNVRGRVRFRADLGPVARLLDARRAATEEARPPER